MNPSPPSALTLLTEEEQALRQMVRDFALKEITPKISKMDHDASMDPVIVQKLFELGIMGMEIPGDYQGSGGSFFMAILAVEELARVDPSVSVLVDVQNTLVNNVFLNHGNNDQKKKFLPQLAQKKVGAYALSEAGSGSDAFALALKADEKGDQFILNGHKLWITNAFEAEIFVIFANVDKTKGYKGITCFVVEKDTPGFQIGKKEDKLGIRASSTCELIFTDCAIPKENLIGPLGKGYKIAIETLNEGRIGIGAQMVGLAQGALDHALRYTQERKQFGKELAKFQGVQFQIADMATKLEAARLLVYNAARLKDAGKPFLTEAAMAKLVASETAEWASSMAVELFGGYGFTKEYPVEKLFRDAKIGKIYEGTSNMQRQTIAKQFLKM
jgi:alkylation response protein AidB-like acyl-CoA dehydrogenase